MIPYQRLLKWTESFGEMMYDYVIVRDNPYSIEGYNHGESGKNEAPLMRLPYSQQDVADEFKKQGKEWRWE